MLSDVMSGIYGNSGGGDPLCRNLQVFRTVTATVESDN